VTTPSDPPDTDEQAEPPKAAPLALELPAQRPDVVPAIVGVVQQRRLQTKQRRGIALRLVVTLLLLAGIAVGLSLILLPRWVKAQVIQGAADHGLLLTIDDASLGGGAFLLSGVHASAPDLPGASATAPELVVETQSLRITKLTVKGAVLTLSGPWSQVEAVIAKWRSGAHGGMCADCGPAELDVEGSRVVWEHPLADNGRVDASDVHLGSTWRSSGTEVHLTAGKVTLAVPGGALGPWRVDIDRTAGTSRVRVALDPGVPEACTLLVVGDDTRTTHVDLVVPRSPVARLGLPPGILGLAGKDLQLAATVHYADMGGGHADAQANGGLYGIETGHLPRPLDVTWEGESSGDPQKGMDVKKARLAAGPLVGALTGTVKTFEDGVRIDLGWSAAAVPCSAFDVPLDQGQPFDIAFQLRKLAEGVGLTKVTGEVSARGSAMFDSRDLGSTKVDFQPAVSCQLALFAP
jgi:hypothetical protein